MGLRKQSDLFEADVINFKEKLQFLNDHLITGPFLTGENMTIADISVSMSLTMATITEGDDCYKGKFKTWYFISYKFRYLLNK